MDFPDVENELSMRENIRKFNHKVPNQIVDLKAIFKDKDNMNNVSPNIFPNGFDFSSKNPGFSLGSNN